MASSPAKITRPQPPPGTVLRPRLFDRLAQGLSPIVWIVAPPGAGKTTLVSSFLQQSRGRCLWYQLDAGDADPATFFHYMGLAGQAAAPRVRRPLPHLTPEYLPSLPLFTQRYFEEIYRRLQPGGTLVFDNYQEVDADAALHGIVQSALSALPPDVRVIVMSRAEPPPALARLRAGRSLALLAWEAIRLTADESRAIARAHSPQLPDAAFERLHGQTQGWAAGLILALERAHDGDGADRDAHAPQAVFDYFAEEIFAGMNATARHILLHCAFLPRVTAAQAAQLSGVRDAGHLFATLNARGYFTLRHAGAGYQLHPLFRAFLLNRAQRSLEAAELTDVRRRAAAVLEEAGEVADAIDLLVAAEAWEEMAAALERHAEGLLRQGRAQTIEKWLRATPAHRLQDHAGLAYWLGLCRLSFNPLEARGHFERAFELAEARDDVPGMLRAWAAIVDTFVYDWGDFSPLDRWVAVMDALLQRHELPAADFPRVACGMFAALVWRQPQRPDLPEWAERVMHIVLESDLASVKMALGNNLLIYYLWMGDFSKAAVVIDALRPHSHGDQNEPLTQLHWWVMLAMYSWFAADHRSCLEAIAEGERLSASSGVHLLDLYLLAQGAYSGLSQGDPQVAGVMLDKMAAIGSPRLMDKSLYQYQAASVHWDRDDLTRAREHGRGAVELAEATGSPLPVALTRIEFAFTLFEQGEHAAAQAELALGAEAGRGMKHIEFMVGLYSAHFALHCGDAAAARESLRGVLPVGAAEGYLNTPRWNPAMMAPLCGLALEHGIEPDYVRGLIRRRGLTPIGEAATSEAWPWAVRIRTLGAFSVSVDDAPVELAGRDRRPGELLKAIVALGGRRVSVSTLADALWPDGEGDAAYQALHTNLHRLRKLIGKEAVRSEAGLIALDDTTVWIDAWALERTLDRIGASLTNPGPPDGTEALVAWAETLMRHYGGTFLDDAGHAQWAFTPRERLRERTVRLVGRLGSRLEEAAAWRHAASLYGWALDRLDPATESFYLGAMRSHHRLGEAAMVARLYRRCHATLASLLDTIPSATVETLYRQLKAAAV